MVPATLPVPAAKATPTIPSILALDLGTTTGWLTTPPTKTRQSTSAATPRCCVS